MVVQVLAEGADITADLGRFAFDRQIQVRPIRIPKELAPMSLIAHHCDLVVNVMGAHGMTQVKQVSANPQHLAVGC